MPAQHLAIPFTYLASYVPYKARKARDVLLRDDALVLIHELAEADFPLAARYTPPFPVGDKDGPREDIRFDGRNFYVLWKHESGFDRELGRQIRDELPWAETQRRVTGEHNRYFGASPFKGLQNPTPAYGDGQRIGEFVGGAFLNDNRENRLAQIKAAASRLRIFDGKVWERTGEPCYQYNNGGFHGEPHLSIAFLEPGEMPSQPGDYCRADRLDAFCKLKCGDWEPDCYQYFELLMPSALSLSFEAPALMDAAMQARTTMASHLASVSVEDFRVYAELRDALAADPGQPSEDLISAVEMVLESEAWRPHTAKLVAAYERWRADLRGPDSEPGVASTMPR